MHPEQPPPMTNFSELLPEVLIPLRMPLAIDLETLTLVKQRAACSPLQRARILAHRDSAASLHEMLIAQTQYVYVRPHKHIGKPESMHVIEGAVTLVFFDDDGLISDTHALGTPNSGRPFYFRNDLPRYHTFLIETPFLVFHETTLGPFRRDDTVFAPWAPDESDFVATQDFVDQLRTTLALSKPPHLDEQE